MKYLSLILVSIILVICLSDVKGTNDEINKFVLGGATANPGEFPSAVYIDRPGHYIHCGGTIVHAQHVVTTARCVVQMLPNGNLEPVHSSELNIIAGDLNYMVPSFGREIRHVSNLFIHPQFNYYSRENDIAVLRLTEPFELPSNFIDVATRRQRIVPVLEICQFAGWGLPTATALEPTIELNRINIQIGLHSVCNMPSVLRLLGGRVFESMLCGFSVQRDESVCSGNEGSGLFCNNELTGILSFGASCNYALPGVYTQVRFYNTWLNQQFARNETPEASLW